jgi:hypothetical protein
MSTKLFSRCIIFSLSLLMICGLVGIDVASAEISPAGCTGPNIALGLSRTPTGPVINGMIINYTISVVNNQAVLGGSGCDILDQQIVFACPGADGTASGPQTVLDTNVSFPADGSNDKTGASAYGPVPCLIDVNPGVTTVVARVEASGCNFDTDSVIPPATCTTPGELIAAYECPAGTDCAQQSNQVSNQALVCDVLVDKQVSCDNGTSWQDAGLVEANDDGTLGCTAADGDPILVRYQAQNTGTADLVNCQIGESNILLGPGATVGSIGAGQITGFFDASEALCSDELEAGEPNTADISCECLDDTTEIFVTAFDTATFECVSTELSTNAGPDASDGVVLPGTDRNDTATLTGDAACLGGSVDFYLCGPSDVTGEGCPSGGDLISSGVDISSGTATSGTVNPTTPGHYCWRAEWSGAGVCDPQSFTNNSDECFDVVGNPSCTMDKSVTPTTSKQGDTVTYHLGPICNNGDTTLASATCNDTVTGDCSAEIAHCFPLAPGECCDLDAPSSEASSFADVTYVIQSTDEPGPVHNVVTANCTDEFGQDAPPCSAEADVDLVHPSFTVNKSCTPETQQILSGIPTIPINWDIVLENTGDTGLEICCTDPTAGIDECNTLAAGQSTTITGVPRDVTEADCNDTITNTVECSATLTDVELDNVVTPDLANSQLTDSCSVICPTGCRMTGGHVNMAGSVDAGFDSDSGTHYTTGGQIGAPNESGCPDSPWKGICDDGTCYGGLANGEPCEDNSDCPNDSGHNSTRPWGDWEHNHHGGPDDGYITGGSFSFHSGTAAAPDEAFISNIICTDKGWCVQARPAPNKQIYWEGIGVFHNLKGADSGNEGIPDFPGCDVQVWDKKTGGTLHYYKAHVGDYGEPAGQRQKPACSGGECQGEWAIAGCNQIEGGCEIGKVDNPDKTALHPLCLAQDCNECADWYDIEIHCTTDPASPVIYRVAHYILEGNFQLHPPVGESCNFSCNGVCETGELGYEEMCDPYCDYGDCCVPDGVTIVQ